MSLVDSDFGTFTPATADPRLAAVLARGASASAGFRFTPSSTPGSRRAVTVAIRARSTAHVPEQDNAIEIASATPIEATSVNPTVYNLGAAVGWRRFALSGNYSRIDSGGLPGGRELMDVGVSYGRGRFTTKLSLGADHTVDTRFPIADQGYSLDLGESYSVTHNIDLTGGVRYRTQRERFDQVVDGRRDSQSVYLGTAFRF